MSAYNILFIDQFSGVSGDKINAALFGLHKDKAYLDSIVKSLGLNSVSIELEDVVYNGISALRFNVKNQKKEHIHRNFDDIKKIINNALIDTPIKNLAIKIFENFAIAESSVHNIPFNKADFHEVGTVDAIVDIVCAAASIHKIKPQRIYSTPFYLETGGMVKTDHGILPLPTPAVLELVKGKPVSYQNIFEEIITPTGAAIVASITDIYEQPPLYIPVATGYGAGTKKFEFPNVLRITLGIIDDKIINQQTQFIIETNIDDMNPQLLPDIMEGLFNRGALDVCITNTMMKKSRPAFIISLLSTDEKLYGLIEYLLSVTTTIGVRYYPVQKLSLQREIVTKKTEIGDIKFKRVLLPSGATKEFPEYEDMRKRAKELNIPLYELYDKFTTIPD
ncbi:MAG: nickel pincer cofactor biosynthesis protein LarC [Candidatus Hydrogenedentota bacterium]